MKSPLQNRPPIDEASLEAIFYHADELRLRLELTDGGITWESAPGLRHQELLGTILMSVHSPEGDDFTKVHNLGIAFPDGTVKRPDISVWTDRPVEEEGFVHSIPAAVIEITSPGYEDKDLVEGVRIYLRNGVQDVLVLDRRTNETHHWTKSTHIVVPSPHEFTLACGCRVTV